MIDREIKIPKAFHELHGEKSYLSTLIMVYLAGIGAASIVTAFILPEGLSTWKVILVFILYLDIGGGVVANLSTSTNQYYQGKTCLRVGFIFSHIIHTAILILIFPSAWGYFAFIGLFTLSGSLLVNAFKDSEFQQNLGAFLVLAGILVAFAFDVPLPILFSFAPLFLLKLILGFSVRRPILSANTSKKIDR